MQLYKVIEMLEARIEKHEQGQAEIANKIKDDKRAIQVLNYVEKMHEEERKTVSDFRDLLDKYAIVG